MPALLMGTGTEIVSGPFFHMRPNSISFGYQNFIEVEQHPGKDIASGLFHRLPEGRYNGHDGPKFTIQGYVDTSLSDPTYSPANESGSPYVTLQWLGSLARVGSGFVAYRAFADFIGYGATNGRVGSLPVMIESVRLIPDVNSFKDGSEFLVAYNMEATVVGSPFFVG